MKGLKIGLTPEVRGVGGMVSFRNKLSSALISREIQVTAGVDDPDLDAVLVIGGTRDIPALLRARKRGVRIIQRLDGINWLHRRRWAGVRHALRAELGNMLLRTIRTHIADAIVYQSAFVKSWWERAYGSVNKREAVIHNAVDLSIYTDKGNHSRPQNAFRMLLVEGNLQGGYEIGLDTAIKVVVALRRLVEADLKLTVAGNVPARTRMRHDRVITDIEWKGLVKGDRIPELDRSAHILFSADLNPACPNAVIEALACGLPVAAYDTGSLKELVGDSAGVIVPYGGDPWSLDPPDIMALARAAVHVLENQKSYRRAARRRAEALFDLNRMAAAYLDVLHPNQLEV